MARLGRSGGVVVAKEAIVITVGAVPPKYEQVQVINRRTGEPAMISKDEPYDPGDLGIPYTFKANERVAKSHPAVKANPGAFAELDDVEEELLVGPTSPA